MAAWVVGAVTFLHGNFAALREVRDVDVAGLLSQIATDGDYNPFSLRDLGPAEISAVREALSSPSLREAAPAVLATLREPFDFALVPQEKPLPMDACEFWCALPTGDQEAVLDAFGLSPVPVTMRTGQLAWRSQEPRRLDDVVVHRGGRGSVPLVRRDCAGGTDRPAGRKSALPGREGRQG